MTNNESKTKQSFIAGALTSSAGIFFSKALGLLYVSPLTRMAGGDNTVFYSYGYTYYNILLQICSAGLPFAIAAMVAKYATRGDYKTVLLLRKLAMSIMLTMGVILIFLFMCFATPLASQALGSQASSEDIKILVNVFRILMPSVAAVPFLSAFRSFWQGLKELKVYAFSQVLEQFIRVFSTLIFAFILIYGFHLDGIYAIYMAVLSPFLAACGALVYYFNFDKKHIDPIKQAAKEQTRKARSSKAIVKELIAFGLPYAISAILGNSMDIINNTFFMDEIVKTGVSQQMGKTILSMIQFQCLNLVAIPQVLSIGFPSGIVPYITSALEAKDYSMVRHYIGQCFDVVLYIGMPICACMLFLAQPIYSLFYGTEDLQLGAQVLRYSSLIALTGTITPICTSILMTLKCRKQVLTYLAITFIVKTISFFPCIHIMGYPGAIISSAIASCVMIFLSLKTISNRFDMQYYRLALHFVKIVIACIGMNGLFVIYNTLGFDGSYSGIIINFLILAVKGCTGLLVYFIITYWLQLPQTLTHIKANSMKQFILKFLRGILKR